MAKKMSMKGKHYLVKWLGYPENDNTWELYEHIAETQALHLWESRQHEAMVVEVSIADLVTYEEAVTCLEAKHW